MVVLLGAGAGFVTFRVRQELTICVCDVLCEVDGSEVNAAFARFSAPTDQRVQGSRINQAAEY